MQRPRLAIVAGPNGAGKTTLARELVREWGLSYLSAEKSRQNWACASWALKPYAPDANSWRAWIP